MERGSEPTKRVDRAVAALTALLAAAMALAAISTVTHVEYAGAQTLAFEVERGTNLFNIDLAGVVKARGEVPEGVKVYLLPYPEYVTYKKWGSLPSEYIDSLRSELTVRSPAFVLIESVIDGSTKVALQLNIYFEKKPYAVLAIPAYLAAIGSLGALFAKIFSGLRSEQRPPS